MGEIPSQRRYFLLLYLDMWLTSRHVSPLARVRFGPQIIYFFSVQVQMILYELSLNYFTTSKIFFKNLVFGVHQTPENRKNTSVSELDEIFLSNWISRDESNGEVCFVIRDQEKFQASLNHFDNFTIFSIFQKN